MDWKALATVFAALLLAELGDKTQLAVISFTAQASR
ncbi:MAG TPA: TMEM165/GDT1 family protein [Egibacteraceae bacterium]|nr:TMEM165/GDT1 family protein [Egibacteraceae bacterium]